MTNAPRSTTELAFPVTGELAHIHNTGMTLRDYFAAKAMLMAFGDAGTDIDVNKMAEYCYEMADAMMEARK